MAYNNSMYPIDDNVLPHPSLRDDPTHNILTYHHRTQTSRPQVRTTQTDNYRTNSRKRAYPHNGDPQPGELAEQPPKGGGRPKQNQNQNQNQNQQRSANARRRANKKQHFRPNTQHQSRYEGAQTDSSRQRYTPKQRGQPIARSRPTSTQTQAPPPLSEDEFLSHLPKGPKLGSNAAPGQSNTTYNSTQAGARTLTLPRGPAAPAPTPALPERKYPRVPAMLSQTREASVYERILQVGEGTYGKVYKAKNSLTGGLVALKKLRLQSEREGFPITSIREIKLLQSFDHENVSNIREIMVESSKVIYMIFDYADNDLGGILLNNSLKLSDAQRKHVTRQLLEGCKYLHEQRVIHRDIKGSNILIDNDGRLKITDFGLARRMAPSHGNNGQGYTNRVITLWYRPPELLLGTTHYGTEVDMWGCGCLLLEMFYGKAVFQGANELEQLIAVFQLLGTPTPAAFPQLFDMPWFFMVMPLIKKKYADVFHDTFAHLLPSGAALELARGLLDYDQNKRLTAKQALQCVYFTEDPQPEPLKIASGSGGGCHEYEIKLARKQQRERDKKAQRSTSRE
ncbi:cyclin-dependent serine/threonine protein kinase CTK1 KNAG_0A06140 [Huiozyma naganishii CBS 8797]|uniref:[RNA-polymerase]-subunit kinase n=1 Tax=Huiozyma naganishii (strain ATCC MYA-139 / BCRC 22969 / CBS 8797 / KCTC 17520 / NBRC 10181 / NCYC 3082 / Yp74L-3) TaxID=1071383 RepID=J7S3Y7_HUIN7|nr:hypothetical protein KNAG_0A06140 [Kazachstania naganishii CBS 8797]CCK68276.1 hypothetical protein KNAG_0A06140 [Kazachstania naganishii CBS 8797]